MVVIPYSSSPLLAYGVHEKPLGVVNIPEGAVVARIRQRQNDFIKVYIKRHGRFEGWHADFTDERRVSLRLLYPFAINDRS